MPFQYKTVLIVGATSGMGLAIVGKMIENGVHVIAVGRRQEKLDDFSKKHGSDKWSSLKFDITNLDKIPEVTKTYPKLDCVLLNSGIQRRLDFSDPKGIDLDTINTEFTTNYFAHVHLIKNFLPFLTSRSSPTAVICTTSGLALVRCGNYCASKAAMHQLILVLREQLRSGQRNVKVVEIFPPSVQTELHDKKNQPDIEDGRHMGMSLEDFTNETWVGLEEGKEDIPVGDAKQWYAAVELGRKEMFGKLVESGMGKL